MLYFVELFCGVTAWGEDAIGGEKGSSAQLGDRFPNFNPVGHHDKLESPRLGSHCRSREREIRMCGDDEPCVLACELERVESETRFRSGESSEFKIKFARCSFVAANRVVQT